MRELATGIVRRLQTAGFAAYWVGGCVRDFLLGREPHDYDIATNARPEAVEKLFPHTIAMGRKFGVMVVLERQLQFQVATFRAEADYRDGRHPETVTFGDATADAARRDFTVNGLFYDPVAGQLRDWVGGERDLRAGVLRTIGVPEERFAEDHLRLLRAVRFATQLGFVIEPQTFAAIQKLAPKIVTISPERVRDELVKLFGVGATTALTPTTHEEVDVGETSALTPTLSPRRGSSLFLRGRESGDSGFTGSTASPSRSSGERVGVRAGVTSNLIPIETAARSANNAAHGLDLLRDSGLLQYVLPELAATITCEQSPDFHPEGSVYNHIRLMLSHLPPDAPPLLAWAVLLHDIAKPMTASRDPETGSIHFYEHERIGAVMAEEILERLRFPKKQIAQVVTCVRYHMQFKDAPQMRKATLRRLLLRDTFPLELALHRLDCLGSHHRLEIYDFLVAQAAELEKQPALRPPLLTGMDLQALGMSPGPALGALLTELRDKQLAEELQTPEQARAWVKERLGK